MEAWICPKCGRVWGPLVMQCGPCNQGPISTTTPGGWVPPIKRAKIEMIR